MIIEIEISKEWVNKFIVHETIMKFILTYFRFKKVEIMFKKLLIYFLCMNIIGCGSNISLIELDESPQIRNKQLAELNKDIKGKDVKVYLANGDSISCSNLQFGLNENFYQEISKQMGDTIIYKKGKLSNVDIRKVEYKKRSTRAGGRLGFLLGGLAGIAIGAITLSYEEKNNLGSIFLWPELFLIGGLFGIVIGLSISSSEKKIIFTPPQNQTTDSQENPEDTKY